MLKIISAFVLSLLFGCGGGGGSTDNGGHDQGPDTDPGLSDLTFSNNYLEFDGGMSYLQIPTNQTLIVDNQLTIEAFINIQGVGGVGPRVMEVIDSFAMYLYQERIWFCLYSTESVGNQNNGWNCASTTAPSENQWHHVAGVWNGNQLRLYINGQLTSEIDHTASIFHGGPGDQSLLIGNGWTFVDGFNGYISEVRYSSNSRYTDNFTPDHSHEIDEHTIGLWKFEEGYGTLASDSSDNQNHGILNGEVSWGIEAITVTINYLEFDGGMSHVKIPTNQTLIADDQLTIEAFINIQGVGGVGPRVMEVIDSFAMYLYQESIWFCLYSIESVGNQNNGWNCASTTAPSENQWHHVAGVWNGNQLRLYINGQLTSEIDHTASIFHGGPGDQSLIIGNGWTFIDGFNGYISEVRYSSYSRYTDDFTPDHSHETDQHTVGLWKFEEGLGTIATDSSGNRNDGTLNGEIYWGTIQIND